MHLICLVTEAIPPYSFVRDASFKSLSLSLLAPRPAGADGPSRIVSGLKRPPVDLATGSAGILGGVLLVRISGLNVVNTVRKVYKGATEKGETREESEKDR